MKTLKLKRFRSFSGKCFRFFFGLFPLFFRPFSGMIPEKERNLLSFKVRSEVAEYVLEEKNYIPVARRIDYGLSSFGISICVIIF